MLHIDTTAADELHSVNRNAIVKMPPALLSPIFWIWSVMIAVTSPGATRPSMAWISPMRFSIGKKLAIEIRASSAGNNAKKK